tara:strand:- start:339 stop:545 length:207 start_codon:yes stop_codon:yes gene_type:complete
MNTFINTLSDGTIQLKKVDEEGNITRSSYTPDSEINKIKDVDVKTKAEEVWSNAVVSAYESKKQSFYQ